LDPSTASRLELTRLETAHLLLVPMGPDYADALFDAIVISRKELLPWMPWAKAPSREASSAAAESSKVHWQSGTAFHYVMIGRERGDVLGIVGLNRGEPGEAELHYWIRSDYAGRGLTTEAGRAVIKWGWKVLGLTRLTLWAGTENHASRRVAVKLGFMYLGPLKWWPEGGLGDFPAVSYDLRKDDAERYLPD